MDKRIEFFELYKRLFNALSITFNEGFVGKELTFQQYRVLAILNREPRLSSAEIARRCHVSAQATNVIIAKLETANLLRRRPAASGRALEATLTKRGQGLFEDGQNMSLALGDHIFDLVPRRDLDTTIAVLRTLAEALDRPSKVRHLRMQSALAAPSDAIAAPRKAARAKNAR